MTLKQMEYALIVARCASLSEAAKRLYVSQPSISEAMKKLEEELGFKIFNRERNGVSITPEGEQFLFSVQSIMDQIENIEKQNHAHDASMIRSSISVIHYYFMGEIFAELVNKIESKKDAYEGYELQLLDGATLEVIEHVTDGTSEVGIISYTDHNRSYIIRELKKYNLECHEVVSTHLRAFLRKKHPLAERGTVTMKDLADYPYASMWQPGGSRYYFTEEGIFLPSNQKKIYIKDCGAANSLLQYTNAFAMGTGIVAADASDLVTSVEVADAPVTSICWIRRPGHELSKVGQEFLNLFRKKANLAGEL